jgi:hypothetical protein
MTYIANVPASSKASYKRPYKTRTQRRKDDRQKYDESSDRKFLLRVVGLIGILLALAIGCMVKGSMERHAVEAASLPVSE